MKILLIDVNCKYSSTGKIVYDLFSDLKKEGHEVVICYGRGPLIKEEGILKFGVDIETYFHAFMTRITGLTGVYSPVSTKRLIKFIDAFQPDVVHIHELHAYFVNLKPLMCYLKQKQKKVVWTFHCEFMYTGKCGHAHDCEKWKDECNHCPQLRSYPASLFFDFTTKMHKEKKKLFRDFYNITIVTPSIWLADRVKASFLGDKVIRVINNGIDTEGIFYPRPSQYLREKHSLTNEKIVLAVAPNLMSELKGGDWVVEMARAFNGENIKFILIGVDNHDKKFGENIIAMGRISNQVELAAYYSMADIFVICSKKENFPTTCIEALCCGTPIVGFDAGGTKETAGDKYGQFVPYGDLYSLIYEVRQVISKGNNQPSRDEIAGYGLLKYSNRLMSQQYTELYME